ncbi:MAG: small multi-drug export protein [Anaerovoracaceae bacterium]
MIEFITSTMAGKVLSTFFMSMVPVIELRGGVPWGVAHSLPLWLAYITAVLGNMVPVPFIIHFLKRIFHWLKHFERTRHMVIGLEARAHLKGRKVERYSALGLFLLVAVPLPGTGAWTGALVASVLGLPPKKATFLIFLGVSAAGIIMLLLSHGVKSLL